MNGVMNMLTKLDPRTMISDLVQNTVQNLTGSEELGKLAGLIADLNTGNYLGALMRGSELLQGSAKDFQVEAECRWGPGAHLQICGRPPVMAATCPGPSEVSVEVGYQFGFIGWSASFSVSQGGGCQAGAGCAGPGVRSILDDPGLSLEAKVAMLFAGLIDDMDDQIEGKLRDLEAASKAQAQDKAAGGDGESAGNDFNRISTEVQMLMQKRSQMYGMQSNMMSMFNDVSMQIINNVR